MPEQRLQPSAAQQEVHFKVPRAVYANPLLSQRELSKQLSISLGKSNYCMQGLLGLGWIKVRNFVTYVDSPCVNKLHKSKKKK